MKLNLFLKILFILFVLLLFNSTECIKDPNPDDDCQKNRKVVHKTCELLVKGSTMWQMSVANLNGAIPDADKSYRAQITLDFWYKVKNWPRLQENRLFT